MSHTSASQTQGPRRDWFNVNLLGFSHFTSDFYCNLLPIMLPLLALKFDLSYSQCGALYMVFSVTTHFIQPPIGILADRYRVNYLLPLSILLGALFSCAVALCPNLWSLLIVVFIAGICQSGFHPIAGGILPKISPPRGEVMATSIFIAGGSIGFAIAPMIIAYYLDTIGFDNLIYLSALGIGLTIILVLRKLHRNTDPVSTQAAPSLISILKNKAFVLFVTAISLRSWCYCALVVYIPLLLTSHGADTLQSASALTILLLGTVAGGIFTGGLAARYGMKSTIIATFIITMLAQSYFLYDPSLCLGSYIALFITGAGMYGSTPVAIIWCRRILSDSAAGLATSLMLGFAFGLGYIVCVLSGFLGDLLGLRLGMLLTMDPAIIVAMLIICYLHEPQAQLQTLTK